MPAPSKPIKINLLTKEGFDTSFWGQFLQWALSFGRYIIIFTQIIVLSVFFMRFTLDREHIDLKEAIDQKQALISSISDVESEIRRLQDRLKKIRDLTTQQPVPLNIIDLIQNITPVDIYYQDISIGGGRVMMKGNSNNLGSLSSLLYQLKQSNKFVQISLDEVKRSEDGRVDFSLNLNYDNKSFET